MLFYCFLITLTILSLLINNISKFSFSDFDLQDYYDDLYSFLQENYFQKYDEYDQISRFFFFIMLAMSFGAPNHPIQSLIDGNQGMLGY